MLFVSFYVVAPPQISCQFSWFQNISRNPESFLVLQEHFYYLCIYFDLNKKSILRYTLSQVTPPLSLLTPQPLQRNIVVIQFVNLISQLQSWLSCTRLPWIWKVLISFILVDWCTNKLFENSKFVLITIGIKFILLTQNTRKIR